MYMNMKFIEELWKIIKYDDLDEVKNIVEEDFLYPERLGDTSYEKVIAVLKIILSNIKQRKYEDARSLLMILSIVFNDTVEIVEKTEYPQGAFFKSLKDGEIWKVDKSINQSLDMLSIICDFNSVIKEHNELRYWRKDFMGLKTTAEQICLRPETYYQDEILEQGFLNSVFKEPVENINFSIDERIVNVARYVLFACAVLTRDVKKVTEYQDSTNKIIENEEYIDVIRYLEQEIPICEIQKLYKELVEIDSKKFEIKELSFAQQKYIDELNEILKEVFVTCHLYRKIDVNPTEYDQKFIKRLGNIKEKVERDIIHYQYTAKEILYELQEQWLSSFSAHLKCKKEEQLIYYLEYDSFGDIEVNDTRVKMSDVKKKLDDDAHMIIEQLIDYDKSNENILITLDKYLKNVERLRWDPIYTTQKIEYKGEIIDLWDSDVVNWDIDDEPEYDDYLYIILYAYLVGWLLTEDEKYYNGFMKAFFGNYDEPIISCDYMQLDLEFYWEDNYDLLKKSTIEESLKDLIIRICQYWKTYKPYLKYYLDEFDVDKSVIIFKEESRSESENDVGMLNFLSFQIDDEKVEYKKTGIRLSKSEYIKKTRRMTKRCAKMTGKCVFQNLKESIDPVNMLRMLIKKKAINNCAYKVALDYLSKTFEEMINMMYGSSYEYEDISFVANEEYKSQAYCTGYVLGVMASLLTATCEDNIDTLLQGKKELVPFILHRNSNKLTEIETAIERICTKIINLAKKENLIENSRRTLIEFFRKSFPKVIVPDSIFDTLATAEYLYTEYIDDKGAIEGWDYSFISILYYQVLEAVLNNYIYRPFINQYRGDITAENREEFFGKANCFNCGKNGRFSVKESIELGPMGHLLKDIEKNTKLTKFLEKVYPEISVADIPLYGTKLLEVSKRRNLAAHSNKVDYKEAKDDRYIVYSNDIIKFTGELRNMINSVLTIFFSKNHAMDKE